jgi:hypothetical protein
MNCRRKIMKQALAFAIALCMFGLSLSCLAICADHAEQSSCAPDEINLSAIEQEDDCCSLDALRYLPPERIQKTPAGHVTRPLMRAEVFAIYLRQTLDLMARAPQPASSPPLQRITQLRI